VPSALFVVVGDVGRSADLNSVFGRRTIAGAAIRSSGRRCFPRRAPRKARAVTSERWRIAPLDRLDRAMCVVYTSSMVTATQIGIRFTGEDLALVAAIQAKTGIGNRTDVLRLAIRRLAEAEGVELPKPKKKKR
jgi:hypothetical protein